MTGRAHANGRATPCADALPPHNLEAERGVLAAMLLDNAMIEPVAALVRPLDFYRDAHGVLYSGIVELARRHGSVDPIMLRDYLSTRGELDKVGGLDAFAEILGSVPHAVNGVYHAEIVRQKAQVRDLVLMARDLERAAYANDSTADDLLGLAFGRIEAIGLPRTHVPEPIINRLSDVQTSELDWLWPGKILRGKLTMWAGEQKLGKSFSTADLAARVSTGAEAPGAAGECLPLGSVVMLSGEDDDDDTIKPRLVAAGGNPEKVVSFNTVRMPNGKFEPFNLAYVASLERAILSMPDTLLVIVDPVTQFIGARVDDNKAVQLRALLGPLKSLAKKTGVAMLVISHVNKGSSPRALQRVMGSGAYTQIARSNWMFFKDPADRKRRLMLDAGNNLAEDPKGLAYRIIGGRVEWEPVPVDLDADTFLAEQKEHGAFGGDGGGRKSDQAECFLQAILGPGASLPSETLLNAGEAVGLKRDAMFAAKKKLRIRAQKSQIPNGGWVWIRDAHGDSTVRHFDRDSQEDTGCDFGEGSRSVEPSNPQGHPPSENVDPEASTGPDRAFRWLYRWLLQGASAANLVLQEAERFGLGGDDVRAAALQVGVREFTREGETYWEYTGDI